MTPTSECHFRSSNCKLRTVGERDGPDFRTSTVLRVLWGRARGRLHLLFRENSGDPIL